MIGESVEKPDFQDDLLNEACEDLRVENVEGTVLDEVGQNMITEYEIHDRIRGGLEEGRARGFAQGMAEGMTAGMTVGIAEGEAKGKAEGKIEGLAEGRAEGELKKAREMAKGMLAKKFDISVIAEISGLSEEEILALK